MGSTFAPLALAAPTQAFLSTRGTSIVDYSGRVIMLRGVNYPGYEEEKLRLHDEYVYNDFARLGFNVVRLPISWANLEGQPGMFDIDYLLWYVDRDVRWAKKYGLYIVLDMHQDNWATKFGGGGAPDWTVQKYPPTETGMRHAVSDFWNNTALQDHLTTVWTKIARKYANEPTVAGYDILNEPWIYNSIIPELDSSHINAFYVKVIKSIRTVDPNHMIFLEPANMHTSTFPLKENIVWSPHYCPLSFAPKYYPQNITVLEADLAAKYETFVLGMGSPMWIGEFGALMKDPSNALWLQDAVKLFAKYQVGWTYWSFYGSGDSSVLALLSAFS